MESDKNKDIDIIGEYEKVDPAKEKEKITERLAEIDRMASNGNLDHDTIDEKRFLETKLENLKRTLGEDY